MLQGTIGQLPYDYQVLNNDYIFHLYFYLQARCCLLQINGTKIAPLLNLKYFSITMVTPTISSTGAFWTPSPDRILGKGRLDKVIALMASIRYQAKMKYFDRFLLCFLFI